MSIPTAGMAAWGLMALAMIAFNSSEGVGTAAVCFTVWGAIGWLADKLDGATWTIEEDGE